MIDLHTHSNCSDGDLSPEELIEYAHKKKIEVLALTDHDTLSGLERASSAAKKVGIEFIQNRPCALCARAEFFVRLFWLGVYYSSLSGMRGVPSGLVTSVPWIYL